MTATVPAAAALPAAGGQRGPRALAPGLRQAAPLALAGLVANGANVVVTVVLARLLAARGYGALNQLTGVFLVVSMPGSAVIVAVVRRVTVSGAPSDVGRWAHRLHRRATTALVGAAVVVVCAVGPVLADLLRRSSPAGVDAVTVAGGVWILLSLDRGLLQAARAYRPLSANLLAEGAARTVAMVGLVAAGLGVTGAAVGMLAAEVVTAVHARVAADRAWRPVPAGLGVTGAAPGRRRLVPGGWVAAWRGVPGARPEGARRRVVRADLVAALVALATIALLQNVDVIVMGRLDPAAAGAYAAVSVSTKALVFAALVVGGYLLPEAAIRWEAGGHALRQLAVTLLLLAVPASVVVGVAAVLARPFLSGLFSARYVAAAGAFLPLALAMVCLATTVVVTLYLLAVGDRRIAWLLVAGAIAATAAVGAAGGAPRATALADLAVQAVVTAAAAVELWVVHRRRPAGRRTPDAGRRSAQSVPGAVDLGMGASRRAGLRSRAE